MSGRIGKSIICEGSRYEDARLLSVSVFVARECTSNVTLKHKAVKHASSVGIRSLCLT
jgi:hypothetical protein